MRTNTNRLALTLILMCASLSACVDEQTTDQESELGDNDGKEDAIACIALAPECPMGQVPVDSDGDGCPLECGVSECKLELVCPMGEVAIDADDDGCSDTCTGVACAAVIPDCPMGQVPVDSDGDGCAHECGTP